MMILKVNTDMNIHFFKKKTIVEEDLIAASVGNRFKFKLVKMFTSIDPTYFRFTGKAHQ
ncbi:hypothetical protein QWY81_12540 [Polaribacter undariae]|uniref:Uncharacterized protein n=1 Tax=Polaribacter sejongensis TaxID=985043 RepID=A0AAJ1QYE2_9FLAO|nr:MULTISPECIES: hypothetical protein [Polaribacter]MDN3620285.1 hypothetical protein [Polaribacter undariae]UWD32686.1 hypothetical protein NQP51_03190 [Polaribacter undariae]